MKLKKKRIRKQKKKPTKKQRQKTIQKQKNPVKLNGFTILKKKLN